MKKYGMVASSLFLGAAILLGAASGGTMVTDEQIEQFKAGKTERKDVIQTLGSPEVTQKMEDGTTRDTYIRSESHASATSYIPLVGAFIGSTKTKNREVTFIYTKKGVLKDVATEDQNLKTKGGF